ncbi:MAG: hypothetical protein II774_09710 [Lachnospiraceae bacterium]|nr:hypothetical protein [Lachnospiraceae bacterium]MBQ4304751.1 hypothetical protein [Lachnospiraceae bacterium]
MAYAKIKVSSLPNTAYVAPPKPRPANRKVPRPITSSFARRRPPVSPDAESAAKAEPAQEAAEVAAVPEKAAV